MCIVWVNCLQQTRQAIFEEEQYYFSLVSWLNTDNRGEAKINGGVLQRGNNFNNRAPPINKHLRVSLKFFAAPRERIIEKREHCLRRSKIGTLLIFDYYTKGKEKKRVIIETHSVIFFNRRLWRMNSLNWRMLWVAFRFNAPSNKLRYICANQTF